MYSQGALSQAEKECFLLKEQLKAARAGWEQTELRSAEEPRDLEEKLRRHAEESKVPCLSLPLGVGGPVSFGELTARTHTLSP